MSLILIRNSYTSWFLCFRMEWKKPFALFAGSFGFFLSFALYLLGIVMTGNSHVVQVCPPLGHCAENWICNSFSMLICTYLEDFKSFGYNYFDVKAAAVLIGLFYMILNGLLCVGLIKKKPEFILGYQIGNVFSTIALFVTVLYVSYLIKIHTYLYHSFKLQCNYMYTVEVQWK